MKKITLLLVCFFIFAKIQAQDQDKKALLQALNRDIWKPFSEAYREFDLEKYMALHSKDLIRSEGGQKVNKNLSQYTEGNRQSFENAKKNGAKYGINFRFLERIVNKETASERGIFEFVFTNAKGEEQRFYGKFHVFSRQEKGVWKILVDYDSNENGTINAESFQKAFGMEEFEKY